MGRGCKSSRGHPQSSVYEAPSKTPHEFFYGTKPSITHLQIFGSPAFVHIAKNLQSKLEPCFEKCILLSFDAQAKAYRCYKPSTKRVFVSKDLLIDEAPLVGFNSPAPPLLGKTHLHYGRIPKFTPLLLRLARRSSKLSPTH